MREQFHMFNWEWLCNWIRMLDRGYLSDWSRLHNRIRLPIKFLLHD
jgi:hypothetical protein